MSRDILAAIDPRAKLVAFLAVQALLFIPPPQHLRLRLATLAILLLFLLSLAGRAWRRWLRLMAISAPLLAFLGFSAFFQPGAGRPAPQWIALAITAKAMLVLLSLALFILGEQPGRLLQALRQTGMPRSAVVILDIGLRFSDQWRFELEGMRRAWTGRNLASLPRARRAWQLGRTLPMFFERLMESSVHVHDAMVSRGFSGTLPVWRRLAFTGRDAAFLALTALAVALLFMP